MKNLSMNKQVVFYLTMKFYTTINQDFRKTTWQTHASRFYMIKFWRVLIRAWWLAWYWLTSKRLLIRLTMIYYWKSWALLLSQIILLVGSNHKFRKLLFRSFQYYMWGTTRVHSGTITVSHIREWHATGC